MIESLVTKITIYNVNRKTWGTHQVKTKVQMGRYIGQQDNVQEKNGKKKYIPRTYTHTTYYT